MKKLLIYLVDILLINLLRGIDNMEIPNHLKHKPILKLENYSKLDGKYSKFGKTDAQGLSVGVAQWSDADYTDLSAKVWRYDEDNEKWSRQSEEMPLHRALDLASLVCAAISYSENSSIPMIDDFNIDLRKDQKLLSTLSEGIKNDKENLHKSLKRLSSYLDYLKKINLI